MREPTNGDFPNCSTIDRLPAKTFSLTESELQRRHMNEINAIRNGVMQYNTIQVDLTQHNRKQYIQLNAIIFNTIQYNSI